MHVFRMHSPARDPFDATGAMLGPGRWHTRGTRVLYTAENISLAFLETLAHLNGTAVPPKVVSTISVPDNLLIEEGKWLELPASRAFGDRWVREQRSAVLAVPSITVHKLERNFVLNPAHPDFPRVKHHRLQPFAVDSRFIHFP